MKRRIAGGSGASVPPGRAMLAGYRGHATPGNWIAPAQAAMGLRTRECGVAAGSQASNNLNANRSSPVSIGWRVARGRPGVPLLSPDRDQLAHSTQPRQRPGEPDRMALQQILDHNGPLIRCIDDLGGPGAAPGFDRSFASGTSPAAFTTGDGRWYRQDLRDHRARGGPIASANAGRTSITGGSGRCVAMCMTQAVASTRYEYDSSAVCSPSGAMTSPLVEDGRGVGNIGSPGRSLR